MALIMANKLRRALSVLLGGCQPRKVLVMSCRFVVFFWQILYQKITRKHVSQQLSQQGNEKTHQKVMAAWRYSKAGSRSSLSRARAAATPGIISLILDYYPDAG